MGWETRGNRKYYYRKKRQGKRVVSHYLGAGPRADVAAEQVASQHSRQAAEQQQLLAQAAGDQEIEDMLDQLEFAAGTIVKVAALLGGYYPHKGQWRRKAT